MTDQVNGKGRRRRRSWYRRRLRIQRGLAFGFLVAAIAFACWQNAARFLSLPRVHSSQFLPDSFSARTRLHEELAWTPAHAKPRPKYVERIPGIYPYSVVPGGLKDAQALRQIAAADRAVLRHYAQFDYNKARLIRLTEAREMYVSYRIRDTIFWTRKKIHLLAGELLLTDGKIMARAKCGNQVSDTAKPEISEEEPEEDVLDTPVAIDAFDPIFPARGLLPPPDLPTGTPLQPSLFSGGFSFPTVPFGGLPPAVCRFRDGRIDPHCHQHKKPRVPEPSTLLLIASGLGLIAWQYRTRVGKSALSSR